MTWDDANDYKPRYGTFPLRPSNAARMKNGLMSGVNHSIERVLRRLITRSFPELLRLRIGIAWEELGPGECFEYYESGGRFQVAASPRMRGASRRAIEGGLAHELAHIARDTRMGPWQRDRAFERYRRSRKYRMQEERATDRLAVERGYGPHLIELAKQAKRLGITFRREHGLLRREVSALVHRPERREREGQDYFSIAPMG